MKETGLVIAVTGEYAEVEIARGSACDSCASCEMHGGCHTAFTLTEQPSSVVVTAKNIIGAEAGDTVLLTADTRMLLSMTALLFLLPVFLAIATYFFVQFLFSNELYSYLATFFIWILSFLVISKLLNISTEKFVKINVIKIMKKGPGESSGFNKE